MVPASKNLRNKCFLLPSHDLFTLYFCHWSSAQSLRILFCYFISNVRIASPRAPVVSSFRIDFIIMFSLTFPVLLLFFWDGIFWHNSELGQAAEQRNSAQTSEPLRRGRHSHPFCILNPLLSWNCVPSIEINHIFPFILFDAPENQFPNSCISMSTRFAYTHRLQHTHTCRHTAHTQSSSRWEIQIMWNRTLLRYPCRFDWVALLLNRNISK